MAPVNETDMVLFPEGLQALKQVAKEIGLDLRGAYVDPDGGLMRDQRGPLVGVLGAFASLVRHSD